MELKLKNITSYKKDSFTTLNLSKKLIYFMVTTVVENQPYLIISIIQITRTTKNANVLS